MHLCTKEYMNSCRADNGCDEARVHSTPTWSMSSNEVDVVSACFTQRRVGVGPTVGLCFDSAREGGYCVGVCKGWGGRKGIVTIHPLRTSLNPSCTIRKSLLSWLDSLLFPRVLTLATICNFRLYIVEKWVELETLWVKFFTANNKVFKTRVVNKVWEYNL